MKRALFLSAALAALISFSGCACTHGTRLRGLLCRGFGRGSAGTEVIEAGPPTGAVAYPYYTTRGPRDFLVNDPPSIGP